ncbi:MAG: ferrous iron transport protein A [Ignavibacteriales bacterium]|nr:ferrous iron transport protein A [Ignavibacteriales bacterium]
MYTLAEIPAGTSVTISRLESHPETCLRLRELGFCENATIRCVTNGTSQLICEVCNTKVGLNFTTANSIIVTPL